MAVSGKKLWQRLSAVYPLSDSEKSEGLKLFKEYTHSGYLNEEDYSSAEISSGGVIDFFRRLSLLRSASSPVCRRRDARWMGESNFQFFQLRDAGSFFQALRILPYLRIDGLVLLPVTQIQEEFPLYPVSHSLLDKNLSDPLMETAGLTLEEQFHLFLAAAHLTGLKVGYYLSPLVAPDSAVIYRKPEFFQWLLNGRQPGDRQALLKEVERITAEEFQKSGFYDYPKIRERVNGASLTAATIGSMEDTPCFNLENPVCREYFADIFLNLQSRYSLDFIFLSLPEGMNPREAEETVLLVQSPGKGDLKKYTGWIVEYPESEEDQRFQEITNLLSSPLSSIGTLDEQAFHDWFHNLGRLFDINSKKKIPFSRTVLLPSESGDPASVLRFYFLTRFSGLRGYRRPLLLGNSYLTDREFGDIQNRIEDVYTRYTSVFTKGRLLKVVADESFAWWIIRERNRILISLISLDRPTGPEPGSKPVPIRIDYGEFVKDSKVLTVVEYDFTSSQGSLYLSADNSLLIDQLENKGVRLFSLQ